MGRELKRKENKKNGKNVRDAVVYENDNPMKEVYKLLKILIIVLVILIIIYLMVGIFITKEISFGNKKDNDTEVIMQSDYLLASETFRQKEEKYYVYFYDFNETNSSIETLISSKLKEEKVYRVDTSSDFNKKYISETSNPNVQNKEELKINGITLIVIENGKNIKYLQGEDAITNYIKG